MDGNINTCYSRDLYLPFFLVLVSLESTSILMFPSRYMFELNFGEGAKHVYHDDNTAKKVDPSLDSGSSSAWTSGVRLSGTLHDLSLLYSSGWAQLWWPCTRPGCLTSWNRKCKDFSIRTSFGPSRIILVPPHFRLEDLSIYRVHHSSLRTRSPCKSLAKSTKHYAFIIALGLYRMENSDTSTGHDNIRPAKSCFCKIF